MGNLDCSGIDSGVNQSTDYFNLFCYLCFVIYVLCYSVSKLCTVRDSLCPWEYVVIECHDYNSLIYNETILVSFLDVTQIVLVCIFHYFYPKTYRDLN